jgi:methylmalonyl-CoA mutase C-terminal domain/subunit
VIHTSTSGRLRVVVAKVGLDGHDRGAKIIARALRDAGMEVIYTGLHLTPEEIVASAIQEDADAVGISILSGAHMTLVPRIVNLLREREAHDVLVTVGGTIPDRDIPVLKDLGVAEVFTPRRQGGGDRRLPEGGVPARRGGGDGGKRWLRPSRSPPRCGRRLASSRIPGPTR